VQPTFVRFVFEMPDGVNVSSVLNDQKLTLQFNSVLNFDLADAKVAAPPNIASINQRADVDSSAVDIVLIGEVDVHSFREEKNYVIDVAFQQAEKPALAVPQAEVKPDVPAKPGPAVRISRDKALKESPPLQQPAEIPPATSETIAEQARIEIKPAQATEAPAVAEAATPAVEKVTPAKDPVPSATEKMAAAAETTSPPAEAAKVAQPAEQVQAAVAEAPKAMAPKQAPPPAEPPKQAAPAASSPPPESGASDKAVTVEAKRDSDGLRVTFSFAAPTPAALFRRADTVWLVFDHVRRRRHRRCQPAAARKGPGHPHPPQPAADSFTRKRRPRQRRRVDADLRRPRPDDTAAADGAAEHHRSRARQCHRAAGQCWCDAPAGRSRCRRYAARRHCATADPRPH
jgi:hypothetical protein